MGKVKIPKKVREQVIARDGLYCVYCGIAVVPADKYPYDSPRPNRKVGFGFLTIDHRRPYSKGGTSDVRNCVVACYDCNTGKGDRSEIPVYKTRKFWRFE